MPWSKKRTLTALRHKTVSDPSEYKSSGLFLSCLTWEKYPKPLKRPGPSFLYQELLWFRIIQMVYLWRRKKKNPHELSWYSRERWRGFYRMMKANGEVLKSPIPLQTHLQKYHSHTHARTHTHTRHFQDDESDNPLISGVVSALVTGKALHLRVDEDFWKW